MAAHAESLHTELRDWLEQWAEHVRALAYEQARALFDPQVIGFGTHMRLVHGLERLEAEQWRNVWGTIADFRFVVDELVCGGSADGLDAWAIVPWSSTGFHKDGTRFDRPGRATILYRRVATSEHWRAIHTHISLAPGTPQRSHGRRG